LPKQIWIPKKQFTKNLFLGFSCNLNGAHIFCLFKFYKKKTQFHGLFNIPKKCLSLEVYILAYLETRGAFAFVDNVFVEGKFQSQET
jgi:hypothetical protein